MTSDGDHWARQRKLIAGVVNERVSKAVFNESVVQTKGLLQELSSKWQPNGNVETNQLFNMAKKVAINVLSAAGMGNQVPWDDNADEQPKRGFKQTYIQSIKNVINGVAGPIVIPMWILEIYPSFLPGAKYMHELGIAMSEFPIHTMDMLQKERQRSKAEGSATKNNVLSQLLQVSEQPGNGDAQTAKGAGGKTLSDSELVGNLFLFTAAGFDTTANTLSYALIYLARHPNWQDWVLEEIDAILPPDPTAELDYVVTYPKAVRVMAFMMETLRHFTPLVHISKQTKTSQTITTSTGTYFIPTNTTVYINSIALHGDANLWRGLNAKADEKLAEDDEWQFRPSRFVNRPGSSQPLFQPPKGTYIPWSAGPRVCPGQKMAQVEFTAIFLTLLRQHRVEAVSLPGETRTETDVRLDRTMHNSMSILTMTMKDVYEIPADSDKGLKLALARRR